MTPSAPLVVYATAHKPSDTNAASTKPGAANIISLAGYIRATRDPSIAILDLRTKDEYELGRMVGSINIDAAGAESSISALSERLKAASMIIVYGSPHASHTWMKHKAQLEAFNKSVFFCPTAVDDWRGAPFGWATGP